MINDDDEFLRQHGVSDADIALIKASEKSDERIPQGPTAQAQDFQQRYDKAFIESLEGDLFGDIIAEIVITQRKEWRGALANLRRGIEGDVSNLQNVVERLQNLTDSHDAAIIEMSNRFSELENKVSELEADAVISNAANVSVMRTR